jgi:uncharacterized protein
MRIWIDIENTPHAMIFSPIIRAMKQQGHEVVVTAKNIGFALGILNIFEIPYILVGEGVKQKKILKAGMVLQRILALAFATKNYHIDLGLNHGSRSHIGACWLRRIRCITSYDYEYSSKFMVHQLASLVLVPQVFDDDLMRSIGASLNKVRRYPGLKEELYLANYRPNEDFSLPVPSDCTLVVIRPPSSTGHYHNPVSETTFYALMDRIVENDSKVVGWIVPRTKEEGERLTLRFSHASRNVFIQKEAVNGLDLIWRADLVVSGGGTMIREAAVMGVPAYSIFASKIGAVDRSLVESKRLKLIRNPDQVDQILMVKRQQHPFVPPSPNVLNFFLDTIDGKS